MDNKIKVSAEGKNIINKENGVIEVKKATEEEMKEIRKSDTLCFDCANLENCQKVTDQEKQSIDKYDFISDGAQVIDEFGEIENFVVNDCKDFIKEEVKKYSGPKVVEVRRELKKNYFDAETIEEANKICDELEYRNSNSKRR